MRHVENSRTALGSNFFTAGVSKEGHEVVRTGGFDELYIPELENSASVKCNSKLAGCSRRGKTPLIRTRFSRNVVTVCVASVITEWPK